MAVMIGIFLVGRRDTAEEVREKSIAVFPLCLDEEDSENAYFCEGMAEELYTQMGKIRGLTVKTKWVIESYIGKPLDLENIRRRTGLDFLLTVGTLKSGNNLRISIRLIDLVTGNQVWADSYVGDYTKKIFEFHSSTAREIATYLDVVITPEIEKELETIPAENIRAYDEVIKGRYEIQNFWDMDRDRERVSKANVFFDNALKIVPDYMEALGGKSSVFIANYQYDSAHYYADRMIELDRFSNKGYGNKAEVYLFTWDLDLAIENYIKAISLPPKDRMWIWWHAALGRAYYFNNDMANAIKYFKKSLHFGIEAHLPYSYLGLCYEGLGVYDKAETYYLQAFMSKQGNCWDINKFIRILCIQSRTDDALNYLDSMCAIYECEEACLKIKFDTYMFGHRFTEAAETYEQYKRFQRIPGTLDSINLSCLYLKTGKKDSADLLLKPLRLSFERRLYKSRNLANTLGLSVVHGLMNNREAMNRRLNEALERGLTYYFIDLIRVHPAFKVLWEYPGLEQMIDERMKKRDSLRAVVEAMKDLEFRTGNTE